MGKYDLVSLISERAVDLDHDGTFSKDIIAETQTLTAPTFSKNMERYFMEITTEIYNWKPKFYYQSIFLWAPNSNVFTDGNGNYLYTDYGCAGLLAKYRYNEEGNTIDVLGNLGGGEVISVKFFRNNNQMK